MLVDALRAADVEVAEPHLLPTADGLHDALQAARSKRTAYVLCFCEQAIDERATREIADIAGCVVHFAADPTAPLPYALPPLLRVLHAVVPTDADGRFFRRDAFALNVSPQFYGAPLDELPVKAQRILLRLARAIGRRRVASRSAAARPGGSDTSRS